MIISKSIFPVILFIIHSACSVDLYKVKRDVSGDEPQSFIEPQGNFGNHPPSEEEQSPTLLPNDNEDSDINKTSDQPDGVIPQSESRIDSSNENNSPTNNRKGIRRKFVKKRFGNANQDNKQANESVKPVSQAISINTVKKAPLFQRKSQVRQPVIVKSIPTKRVTKFKPFQKRTQKNPVSSTIESETSSQTQDQPVLPIVESETEKTEVYDSSESSSVIESSPTTISSTETDKNEAGKITKKIIKFQKRPRPRLPGIITAKSLQESSSQDKAVVPTDESETSKQIQISLQQEQQLLPITEPETDSSTTIPVTETEKAETNDSGKSKFTPKIRKFQKRPRPGLSVITTEKSSQENSSQDRAAVSIVESVPETSAQIQNTLEQEKQVLITESEKTEDLTINSSPVKNISPTTIPIIETEKTETNESGKSKLTPKIRKFQKRVRPRPPVTTTEKSLQESSSQNSPVSPIAESVSTAEAETSTVIQNTLQDKQVLITESETEKTEDLIINNSAVKDTSPTTISSIETEKTETNESEKSKLTPKIRKFQKRVRPRLPVISTEKSLQDSSQEQPAPRITESKTETEVSKTGTVKLTQKPRKFQKRPRPRLPSAVVTTESYQESSSQDQVVLPILESVPTVQSEISTQFQDSSQQDSIVLPTIESETKVYETSKTQVGDSINTKTQINSQQGLPGVSIDEFEDTLKTYTEVIQNETEKTEIYETNVTDTINTQSQNNSQQDEVVLSTTESVPVVESEASTQFQDNLHDEPSLSTVESVLAVVSETTTQFQDNSQQDEPVLSTTESVPAVEAETTTHFQDTSQQDEPVVPVIESEAGKTDVYETSKSDATDTLTSSLKQVSEPSQPVIPIVSSETEKTEVIKTNGHQVKSILGTQQLITLTEKTEIIGTNTYQTADEKTVQFPRVSRQRQSLAVTVEPSTEKIDTYRSGYSQIVDTKTTEHQGRSRHRQSLPVPVAPTTEKIESYRSSYSQVADTKITEHHERSRQHQSLAVTVAPTTEKSESYRSSYSQVADTKTTEFQGKSRQRQATTTVTTTTEKPGTYGFSNSQFGDTKPTQFQGRSRQLQPAIVTVKPTTEKIATYVLSNRDILNTKTTQYQGRSQQRQPVPSIEPVTEKPKTIETSKRDSYSRSTQFQRDTIKESVAVKTSKNEGTVTQNVHFEKRKEAPKPIVPIIESENFVYAHKGGFHYSYESGDGTKAYEVGETKVAEDGASQPVGVVGGFSYTDKDGTEISLSYTADENGYRPIGAHLPTPPPIPPAIQRALDLLATKTTPEPITEKYSRKN